MATLLHNTPPKAFFGNGSRVVSYMLGGIVTVLAIATSATSLQMDQVLNWVEEVFGITFLGLAGGLVFVSIYAWTRLIDKDPAAVRSKRMWLEAGLQGANGLTTLALTYTLLGISLGVGGLSSQELSPETVQVVVRDLTAQFSMAFLTTVVGLPSAAVLRTLLLVTNARNATREIKG